MWRFIRIGIQNNCGNHSHFRIIGTTCANNEEGNGETNNFDSVISNKDYESNHKSKPLVKYALQNYLKNYTSGIKAHPLNTPIRNYHTSVKDKCLNDIKASQDCDSRLHQSHIDSENRDDVTFGNLSSKSSIETTPDDFEDREIIPDICIGNKLTVNGYGRKILELCKEKKLNDALKVLEVEMVFHNVKPDNYCFNVLINACGKVGYVKKAFDLFHKMKRLGIEPQKHAYTGAFNACGNACNELHEMGLHEARNLRRQIKEKGIVVAPITYHAMIKAFGRCGDIETAFEVVDDMLVDKHRITTDTMNFLLQACISDKETGFRHALIVWKRMRTLRLSPSIYSYNLLLRCARECKAGHSALSDELLKPFVEDLSNSQKSKHVKNAKINISSKRNNALLEKSNGENKAMEEERNKIMCNNENGRVELIEKDVNASLVKPLVPDILGRNSSRGSVVSITSLENATNRLALLGGPTNVVKNMYLDRVQPTIATFTLLLDSIPQELEAENALVSSMESCKVKLDIAFCNALVKRRCFRKCAHEAKAVLDLIREHRLVPDIMTYGCLALTCHSREDSLQLLRDLEKMSIRPNIAIMGSLVKRSVLNHEYLYTLELLVKMKKFGVKADEKLIKFLEDGRTRFRDKLREFEMRAKSGEKLSRKEERQRKEIEVFLLEYKHWLKGSLVQLPEHPWAQYGYIEGPNMPLVKTIT